MNTVLDAAHDITSACTFSCGPTNDFAAGDTLPSVGPKVPSGADDGCPQLMARYLEGGMTPLFTLPP